jgi:hypothetical protein
MSELYNKVIRELESYCHPTCSYNCRWKMFFHEGHFKRQNELIRQTHRLCQYCSNCVSEYSHDLCHKCAKVYNTIEFEYHHKHCLKK